MMPNIIPTPPLKYRPATKVRKLHWDNIVSSSFENSVWSKVIKKQNEVEESLFKSGLLREIDQNFQLREIKSPLKSVQKETSDTELNTILPEKRAQNIMIFLGTMKNMTLESLILAIRTFNDSKLTETVLKQCKASLPTPDEEKLLSACAPSSNLRKAEQFMILVILIKFRWVKYIDIVKELTSFISN